MKICSPQFHNFLLLEALQLVSDYKHLLIQISVSSAVSVFITCLYCFLWISKCLLDFLIQCCPHTETSQLIFCANQLTGFYMRATLAFNRLIKEWKNTLEKNILDVLKTFRSPALLLSSRIKFWKVKKS